MSAVRTALYARLTGDGTLTALLSSADAVYYARAPQSARPPYVIFSKSDGRPEYTAGDYLDRDVWLVKGVSRGTSANVAEQIAARVFALLQDHALAVTGASTLYLRRESDVDYPEGDGGETHWHSGHLYRLITEPDPA